MNTNSQNDEKHHTHHLLLAIIINQLWQLVYHLKVHYVIASEKYYECAPSVFILSAFFIYSSVKIIIYITKILTERNFNGDLAYTIRNKVSKFPIDHAWDKSCLRSRVKMWGFSDFFSKLVSRAYQKSSLYKN